MVSKYYLLTTPGSKLNIYDFSSCIYAGYPVWNSPTGSPLSARLVHVCKNVNL